MERSAFAKHLTGAAVALIFSILHVLGQEPAAPAESPESVRTLLAKWAETQQIISKEREDWKREKDLLQSRIQLLAGEIDTLEGRMGEQSEGTQDVRKEKQGLLAEADSLKGSAAELASLAGELEERLRALEPRLPDPLQERIAPLFTRMPEAKASTAASAAERFQNIAGMVNQINKFNSEITMTTEIRTLADGKPAQVRVIYLGLAQAYFVGAQGQSGIGVPTDSGWEWKADDSIAPQVSEVVEVLQSKAKPKFVPLPVSLK
jgi:hypothetical protein